MHSPAHPLLLRLAEPPTRSAHRPLLARAVGPLDQAPRQAPSGAGLSIPTVTFTRLTPAALFRSVVAQGDAVEAGASYGSMVFGSSDVALTSPRGLVPTAHKAALRAVVPTEAAL